MLHARPLRPPEFGKWDEAGIRPGRPGKRSIPDNISGRESRRLREGGSKRQDVHQGAGITEARCRKAQRSMLMNHPGDRGKSLPRMELRPWPDPRPRCQLCKHPVRLSIIHKLRRDLRTQGNVDHTMSQKKLRRLYREEKLQVRRRGGASAGRWTSSPTASATGGASGSWRWWMEGRLQPRPAALRSRWRHARRGRCGRLPSPPTSGLTAHRDSSMTGGNSGLRPREFFSSLPAVHLLEPPVAFR